MTNAEKYRTLNERLAAFHKFCASHTSCANCPIGCATAMCVPGLRAWEKMDADETEVEK